MRVNQDKGRYRGDAEETDRCLPVQVTWDVTRVCVYDEVRLAAILWCAGDFQ